MAAHADEEQVGIFQRIEIWKLLRIRGRQDRESAAGAARLEFRLGKGRERLARPVLRFTD
jgi:hypothetical protein